MGFNWSEAGRTETEALRCSSHYSYISVSVELLSKLAPLISMVMQLLRSATMYLNSLAAVNGLRRPRELAPSLTNRSRIDIPAALPLLSFLPLSLLHLLSFVFGTSRC